MEKSSLSYNGKNFHICLRKNSRNSEIIVLSSDSDSEMTGVNLNDSAEIKRTDILPVEVEIRTQNEVLSDNSSDNESDETKDPSYSESKAKGIPKKDSPSKISPRSSKETEPRKKRGVKKRLLRGSVEQAKITPTVKVSSTSIHRRRRRRGSTRFSSTSYVNRKRKLTKTKHYPIKRRKRFFGHSPKTSLSKESEKPLKKSLDTRSSSLDVNNEPSTSSGNVESARRQSISGKSASDDKSSGKSASDDKSSGKSASDDKSSGKSASDDKSSIKSGVKVLKKKCPPKRRRRRKCLLLKKKKLSSPAFIHKKGRPKVLVTSANSILKKRGRPKLSSGPKTYVRSSQVRVSFVQHVNCNNGIMKIPKCRECRKAAYSKNDWDMSSTYCRFLDYRKLICTKNSKILIAGFLHPSEALTVDKELWLPNLVNPPADLTVSTAKSLLQQVGKQFCNLVKQEKNAFSLYVENTDDITWKKIVKGVREMCDVCETTLFNIHWVCAKCGFSVCIDCYKVRKSGLAVNLEDNQMRGRDQYRWLHCYYKTPHELSSLMVAQIIPANVLWSMFDLMHKAKTKWNIEISCSCEPPKQDSKKKSDVSKERMPQVAKSFKSISSSNEIEDRFEEESDFIMNEEIDPGLKWLQNNSESDKELDTKSENIPSPFLFDDLLKDLNVNSLESTKSSDMNSSENLVLEIFDKRYPQASANNIPLRTFTVTESSVPYGNVSHSWLNEGKLLLLHQPHHPDNLELFQQMWKRGQPVVVMGISDNLNMSLWHPNSFCKEFGDIRNDLVNCMNGAIIPDLPMKMFWMGFEHCHRRMKDEQGNYMLLKLKDWPPGEDFSEKLPSRFVDLMKGLPLPEYTHRDGIFNLAGRLPSSFVRPDLGPKMYNAYGSAIYSRTGTTNLHLDVSDAVNVMVYVGIPKDDEDEKHILAAFQAIDEGGCDSVMRERVRSKGVRPGALWHIFDPKSADKIRQMLTLVAIEQGHKIEAHHDPIHDQSWYLDVHLRHRLFTEFGVKGYAIAQCLGDAVFIPAGAPHQVRNLHSCVKIAEDFVSPENIAHCFKLTQEFRNLSDSHTNHEDKLQVKNIIYHVVKDSLSHLLDASSYSNSIQEAEDLLNKM